MVLGPQGLQPALISSLIVVCVMFAVALILVEIGLQSEPSFLGAVKSVTAGLLKNPLVVTPIFGGLWAITGLGVAEPVSKLLDMLAAATTPCALISLGLFLSKKQSSSGEGAWSLVIIKLFVQPFVTWVFAFKVFELPALWAHSALLLSALPTGTGPFMIAEYYRREAGVIAKVILLTTLGSIFTVSACIIWIANTTHV
jgi:predicted permease